MEKVWEIKDPDSYLSGKKTVIRKGPPPAAEKDPAKAYSLSMFYWGGGQLYNDELVKGAVFLVTMALLIAGSVLAVIYIDEMVGFLRSRGTSLSAVFLGFEVFLFLIIVFWAYNAADAYQHARKGRRTPFHGVHSRVTPFLCSLAVPGWGQFLNGQPFKGSIYTALAVVGVFSVLSVLLTFLAWPQLDASESRFLVEGIAAVCLAIVPFVPVLWAVSAYDSLRVSLDDLLKESLWERIKAAYYRGRTQGWVKGVFPRIKGTLMLALFLIFFIIVVYYWFPKAFYARQLEGVQRVLSERGMTIVPELIGKILARISELGR